MKPLTEYTKTELGAELNQLQIQYQEAHAQNLSLNMARGKPAPSQLDFSNEMLKEMETYRLEDGSDARNYGMVEGIPECRKLFGDLLGINPDQVLIGNNSSLSLMFDSVSLLCLLGTEGCKPWSYYKYEGTPVKFLCPVPGYDRHFTICEKLGIEMIQVPMTEEGPDMEIVTKLVREDPLIKGIWCVPLYSNPQGICYSDRTVEQLASMETAAPDFRIFWDNAYGVHHIYEEVALKDILKECEKAGHPNRPYYFFSTSKISFSGAGLALFASSPANIAERKAFLSTQTIGPNKLTQLRHVQFFKTPENIRAHMKKMADDLRPKFDLVLNTLDHELADTGLATWSRPKGGYFVSLDTLPGCAKKTIELPMQMYNLFSSGTLNI